MEAQGWVGQFMNTTPNVADMVEIIERLGKWREQETESILARQPMISESEKQRVRGANRWQKGEELLQFWGFSYGTVVGATFAAMQPHRVKRLVLDGVCDAEIMYSGYWATNILDTDKIMTSFFESCHQAGPTQVMQITICVENTIESTYRSPPESPVQPN
ncbi:hypothetical protein N7488_002275 [Penicillium malachiteum]|nr:hypothetical protein N7488_002275 [Penicillium malachiteum]